MDKERELVTIQCTDTPPREWKPDENNPKDFYPSDWGLSLSGPITDEQTDGILEAIRALRPPKKALLLQEGFTYQSRKGWKRVWMATGVVYTHIHYRILLVRQAVPAQNELIGYISVEIPRKFVVRMDEQPHPVAESPKEEVFSYPKSPLEKVLEKLRRLIPKPPDEGFWRLFKYGEVKVYEV